ncbi:MAG: hypothetical protein ACOCUL_03710, partial [Bacteroidota bacterium]
MHYHPGYKKEYHFSPYFRNKTRIFSVQHILLLLSKIEILLKHTWNINYRNFKFIYNWYYHTAFS